jgi:hypothetical protein
VLVLLLVVVLGFFYIEYEYENRPAKTGLSTTSSLKAIYPAFIESTSLTHDHETDNSVKAGMVVRRNFIPS